MKVFQRGILGTKKIFWHALQICLPAIFDSLKLISTETRSPSASFFDRSGRSLFSWFSKQIKLPALDSLQHSICKAKILWWLCIEFIFIVRSETWNLIFSIYTSLNFISKTDLGCFSVARSQLESSSGSASLITIGPEEHVLGSAPKFFTVRLSPELLPLTGCSSKIDFWWSSSSLKTKEPSSRSSVYRKFYDNADFARFGGGTLALCVALLVEERDIVDL